MVNIKHFNVKLEDDIGDWMEKQSKENNITQSDVIRGVLKGWIYGNQHKGFVRVEVKKNNINEERIWKAGLMKVENIIKRAKEYYIFETFFNEKLKNTSYKHSDTVITALVGILKKEKEKVVGMTGDVHFMAEMDDLITAVKNRDLVKLRNMIHPEDVRMNRYMKGNFDDLTHDEMTKLRIFMKELKGN